MNPAAEGTVYPEASFVVDPGALSHSAKIYSQHNQTRVVECARRAKHHLVVHCSLKQRMRVTNHDQSYWPLMLSKF